MKFGELHEKCAFPLFHVFGGQAWNTTAPKSPQAERGSARRPPYGGGGPAGGVLLSCLTPHSAFQRVRAGKPPLHSNLLSGSYMHTA